MRTAIYAGSFDPVTYGHLNVALRAASLFDKLVFAVAINSSKTSFFTLEEREEMARESIEYYSTKRKTDATNIEVTSFTGLLANFAMKYENPVLVRGLRAVSDFEFEYQMALLNKYQNFQVETVFLITSLKYSFLSSSIVKEIAKHNGDYRKLVAPPVYEKLWSKFNSGEKKV
ncbi:MAG TPA: pantetheine-phosphate adenylyltransferase [Candidatus Wallbacteria bacterium]|nr:pantetheine-phosphate adenylyltransferase [Candidatus Wallbacteria bacterium]